MLATHELHFEPNGIVSKHSLLINGLNHPPFYSNCSSMCAIPVYQAGLLESRDALGQVHQIIRLDDPMDFGDFREQSGDF